MSARRRWFPCAITILIAIPLTGVLGLGCAQGERPQHGSVVVRTCEPGGTADIAGLQPGDVVLEWRQGSANGDLESPFQLAVVEQELAPHGPVELTVARDSEIQRIDIPIGRWQMRADPALSSALLAEHRRAEDLVAAEETDAAVAVWTAMADESVAGGRLVEAAWLHMQVGIAMAMSARADETRTVLTTGAGLIVESDVLAAYWERTGDELLKAGQTALAAEAFERASAILEAEAPVSLALARVLLQLCTCDPRNCDDQARRALYLYRAAADDSIEVATALNSSAIVAFYDSDLDAAEAAYKAALDITSEVAPGSPTELKLLGNLGLVAKRRGDFAGARSYYRRMQNAAAELGVDSFSYAHASNYLGLLAMHTGRYDQARLHFEQALEGFRASRPDGIEVAGVLNNLGTVALQGHDLPTAWSFHLEALRLRRLLDAGSAEVASSLHNVGVIARHRGDLAVSRDHLEQALEYKRRQHPGSRWIASTYTELGEVALAEDRLDAAAEHFQLALEIRRRVAPRHPDVADSLVQVGVVERRRDRPKAAEARWREALDIIEEQRRGLGSIDDQRALFGARYRSCYLHLAGLLIDEGREIEAWRLLEEARSDVLRKIVAHRDSPPAGVQPDLWFAKNQTETRVARIESRLARVDSDEGHQELLRYRELLISAEAELAAINREIRDTAPVYAQLEDPAVLSVDRLRRALAPGTVVLAYAVGPVRTLAMVTGAAVDNGPEIRVFEIAATGRDLRGRVDRFNALIARGRTEAEIEPAMISQARKIFDLLATPAWDAIATAERVLIVPDGPLHDLPFSVLLPPGDEDRFLGLVKPLYFNPSASLAVELRDATTDRLAGPRTVVAFGDPLYLPGAALNADFELAPLPGSRAEIEAIRRLFGDRASIFLGEAASESNFVAHSRGAGLLHCAVHTRIDPFVPMDSALYFSPPAGAQAAPGEGVLSGWEIAENLKIDADVVVLSGCSSARGRTVPGEGVIGLARAFHIAGARTLVASQWEVSDHATAVLMTAFYEELAEGRSTVDALLSAQRVVAANPMLSHPYYWAAFQIRGDWR